jgi:hypothetical protein
VSTNVVVLAAVVGVAALLAAYLVARRLIAAGYTAADALVIEAIALIGSIGAVQSYTALRWLAVWGDLAEPVADVAPATVDVFAVAMGYAAFSARRRKQGARDRYADLLALSYSVAAVLANLAAAGIDVSDHGYTGPRVAVVLLWHVAPVITFLLGSHWLMRRPVIQPDPDMETVGAADRQPDMKRSLESPALSAPPAVAPVIERPAAAGAAGQAVGNAVAMVPAPIAVTATDRRRSSRRPSDAREAAIRLVRRAMAAGRPVTTEDIQRETGRKERQARRLLAEAIAAVGTEDRPRVLASEEA